MSKSLKGLIITAIVLTIILIVFSIMTINRWRDFSEEEAKRQEILSEFYRFTDIEVELLLELEELKQ